MFGFQLINCSNIYKIFETNRYRGVWGIPLLRLGDRVFGLGVENVTFNKSDFEREK